MGYINFYIEDHLAHDAGVDGEGAHARPWIALGYPDPWNDPLLLHRNPQLLRLDHDERAANLVINADQHIDVDGYRWRRFHFMDQEGAVAALRAVAIVIATLQAMWRNVELRSLDPRCQRLILLEPHLSPRGPVGLVALGGEVYRAAYMMLAREGPEPFDTPEDRAVLECIFRTGHRGLVDDASFEGFMSQINYGLELNSFGGPMYGCYGFYGISPSTHPDACVNTTQHNVDTVGAIITYYAAFARLHTKLRARLLAATPS